jgi:hypothetical protein
MFEINDIGLNMSDPELLPCPCCGTPAKFVDHPMSLAHWIYVYCPSCFIRTKDLYVLGAMTQEVQKQEFAAVWNRRVT